MELCNLQTFVMGFFSLTEYSQGSSTSEHVTALPPFMGQVTIYSMDIPYLIYL